MQHKKLIPFITKFIQILFILLLIRCGGGPRLTEDETIQKDITIAVNNYNSDDWRIRLNSVKSISKYRDSVYAKNSLLLLIKATDDSHSEVQIEALQILKKMKAPAAEDKIRMMALSDENSNVRFFAFSALEEYENIKNENTFLKGLEDTDWLVKEASLKGLMKINDPEIQFKHLKIILNSINDNNISIKLAAISSLKIKDPLIYAELSRIINNKESGLSILKAALVKTAGYRLDNKTKQRLIVLLTHRDKDVRLLSLQVLKQEKPDN